jgi:putative ABC transport system permease protein
MPYDNYAMRDKYNSEWGAWTNDFTYVLLHPGTNIAALNEKIHKTITQPRIWPRWDSSASLLLFPFTDSRLRNNFNNDGQQAGGRIYYVQIFGAVGIFVLVVAIINFMNLATARSISRSKEIGVRKVSGAVRLSLIRQFFSESVLMAMIALGFALVIVQITLPAFNSLTHKDLSINLTNPALLILILSITLLTGILAGSYPAFLLSALKPVVVLKGRFTGAGGKNLRRSLVVVQFAISTILIVCALAANQQVKYMKEKDLGFDRDNILYFPASKNIDRNMDAFRRLALEDPKIISVAEGNNNPMNVFGGMVLSDNAWPGKTKDDNILFTWTQCDEDYLPTLGLNIVKGRNFSKDNISDSLNYIINEEAARQMKLTDPVGAKLMAPHPGTIVGVVNDFISGKLQFKMAPVIIAMTPKRNPMVFVRYEAGQAQEVLASLQTIYKTFEADIPIEYKFMDAPFGEMYENEIVIEKLSMYFTVIAIFISCLGLFGLASFTAETRTKEIGIRKVLGASVTQIVALLCRDFVLLIAIALVIGLPIGWWGIDQFLKDYAYHIDISPWLFVSIVVGLMGTTFLSVAYQSGKAANTNPVKTLRSE